MRPSNCRSRSSTCLEGSGISFHSFTVKGTHICSSVNKTKSCFPQFFPGMVRLFTGTEKGIVVLTAMFGYLMSRIVATCFGIYLFLWVGSLSFI